MAKLVNATNLYSNSRYIVDNVTPTTPYQTIQAAINDANAAGGNNVVYIRAGSYSEDITLYDGIHLIGSESDVVTINGQHSPPLSGTISFSNLRLSSNADVVFSSGAGTTSITFTQCNFNLTIGGAACQVAAWTGAFYFYNCTDSSSNNKIFNNTSTATLNIRNSNLGGGSSAIIAFGNVTIFASQINVPLTLNGSGTSVFSSSYFTGGISALSTHSLSMNECRINTGAAPSLSQSSSNTLYLNDVVIETSSNPAINGTGELQISGLSYVDSDVIGGTVTVAETGIQQTAEIWANNIQRMVQSGFYSWASSGPYFDDTTLGTFTVLVGGTGYIKGKRVTWAAPQSVTGMTAGNSYYIYVDSTGTLQKTSVETDVLYEDNIPLFECLRDSTSPTNNQVTIKENHPYSFQTSISNYLNAIVGSVIENKSNGANITINGTQGIQINGSDVLSDHGLYTDIPDSGGSPVVWNKYYTNAGGKWARQNATTTFTGFYNNAGTPTALGASNFGVYRLYVSKDNLNSSSPIYFAVLDTQQYNSLANAQTAVGADTPAIATNELASLELAQLGLIIYAQTSSSIVQVTIAKSTLQSTVSTAGTNTASLVNLTTTNFNGTLSASDTNVQAAFETLDEYRGGLYPLLVTADGTLSANRRHIIKNATPSNLTTVTLPATAIQGDTISIQGYTTGGWLLAQPNGVQVFFGNNATTIGIGGSIASSNSKDSLTITCVTANNEWAVCSAIGNMDIV
jgi:hypothetical protein